MSTPNAKKTDAAKKFDFEKSIARLEEVVQKLETAEVSLDEAMKLFEEGVKLAAECQQELAEAEGKIEILMKKATGKMSAERFEPENEESGNG